MTSVYVITDPCVDVKDKSCIEVCPVDCIHTDDEADRVCYIDPDECIGCNLCLPACPVGAIFTADDVPGAAQPWVEVNALWFRDPTLARARVDELA
jgi:NAD-dependent dihydropyrimidine dehydrogenase PreA subunit